MYNAVLRFAQDNFFQTLLASESINPIWSASTGVVLLVAPLSSAPMVVVVSAGVAESPVFVPVLVPLPAGAPTIAAVMPPTLPVNVGAARLAFRLSAVCCAVDTGLPASLVLSTEPRPTIDFVIPLTVPVNVGDVVGAFASSAPCRPVTPSIV